MTTTPEMKERILAKQDLPFEDVVVPEWGETVMVRGMTCGEREQYEQLLSANKLPNGQISLAGLKVAMVVKTAHDLDFKPLFTETDRAVLETKSASAIEKLFLVAQRLSGGRVEDLEKN